MGAFPGSLFKDGWEGVSRFAQQSNRREFPAVADHEVGDAALDEPVAIFFDVAVVVADVVVMDERLPVFFFGENDMAVVNGVRTR